MNITINSKKYGTSEFYMPDEGGYIRILGKDVYGDEYLTQICERGGFRGRTLTASPKNLRRVCYDWMRTRASREEREGHLWN